MEEMLAEVRGWGSRVGVMLRGEGLGGEVAERMSGQVLLALRTAMADPVGQWLLRPRLGAESEAERTLWSADRGWERVRMDRIFRAGAAPGAEGSEFLWIVDVKTGTHGREGVEQFLRDERERYRGQMETYARVMGEAEARVGLYYPLLARLVWWVPEVGLASGGVEVS